LTFEILVIAAGLVTGWIRHGNVWNFSNLRLRIWWLFPIPYILQHISIVYLKGEVYAGAIILSYVLLLFFCLINVKTPGVVWALAGTFLNFVAMATNGLRMPAYVPAVRGMAPQILTALQAGSYGKSIAMTNTTHLNFLGDIFAFNVWPGNLLSIGDILFSIGLIVLIQAAMRMKREGLVNGNA
jgi:hypothetical protein